MIKTKTYTLTLKSLATLLLTGLTYISYGQGTPATAISVNSSDYLDNADSGGCTPTSNALVAGSGIAACQGVSGQEYWISFTAETQAIKATLSGIVFDGVIELFEAGTLNSLACENSAGNGGEEVLRYNELSIGDEYLIRFRAIDGSGGAFSYCLEHYPMATIRNGWHPHPPSDDDFPGYKVTQNTQRPWLGTLIQATRYYLTDIDSGDSYEHQVNGSSNLLNLNVFDFCYGLTLSVYVEVQVDDYWCGISEERIIELEDQPYAQINPTYFGATVTLGELIQGIYLGPNQQFEWRFTTDNGNTVILESSNPGQSQLFFGQTSCLRYNRIYSVEVRASYCSQTGPWSEPTFIVTPAVPYNKLRNQYCDEFLQPFSVLQCDFAPGATGYTWQVAPIEFNDPTFTPIGPAFVATVPTNNTVLFLSQFGLTNGQSYRVAVKNVYADCDNFQQGDYGEFCQITIGSASGVQARMSEDEIIADVERQIEEQLGIHLYPNPMSGQILSMEVDGIEETQPAQLEVFDLNGRLVYAEQLVLGGGSNWFQMEFPSSLTSGTYVVSLRTQANVFNTRFVKTTM